MKCNKEAWVRYTWPGKDEAFACLEHSRQLTAVSNALGMHLQLIPVSNTKEHKCEQEVKEDKE